MSRPVPALVIMLALFAAGCAGESSPPAGGIRAFAGIPPLAYFAERIGGEHVQVQVLVQPGQSPHSYEPTPKQMAELSHAQVYFAAGLQFEKTLIPKIRGSNKGLMVAGLYEDAGHAAEGGHEDEHEEHGHSGKDPHTWLNPDFAGKVIVAGIASTLSELDVEHSEYFARNARLLREELDRLSKRISQAADRAGRREFYVFHPAFGHFAEAFSLTQVAIEKHGKEPSAKQLAGLIEKAKKEGVKVIFVQPQFASASAEAVASAIGARIETLDPLAKDYVKNLEDMARRIASAIGGQWTQDEEE